MKQQVTNTETQTKTHDWQMRQRGITKNMEKRLTTKETRWDKDRLDTKKGTDMKSNKNQKLETWVAKLSKTEQKYFIIQKNK